MVRNSMNFVLQKAVASNLKRMYRSTTEAEAISELDQPDEKWMAKYPLITHSWRQNWDNLNRFFAYSPEIRKAIYTTNAIESFNRVIHIDASSALF